MTRIRGLVAAFAASFALARATLSLAATPTATFDAWVVYGLTMEPAEGARVDFDDLGIHAVADARGRVHVAGLPSGTHSMRFIGWTSLANVTEMRFAPGVTYRDTLRLPGLALPADTAAARSRGPCLFSLVAGCDPHAPDPAAVEFGAHRTVRSVTGKRGTYWLAVDRRMPSRLHVGFELAAADTRGSIAIVDSKGLRACIEPILGTQGQLGYEWDGVSHYMTLPVEGRGRVRFTAGDECVEIPYCVRLVGAAAAEYAGLARGEVDGEVVDARGAPFAGADVVVMPVRGTATSDAAGRFHIPEVPAGERFVVAYPQLREPVETRITVSGNATTHVRIVVGERVGEADRRAGTGH